MKTKNVLFSLTILLSFFLMIACKSEVKKEEKSYCSEKVQKHVEWSKNSNIYEVNIRQYTPEGTLNAFADHLPRLKEMGVDILWLMPIQPIGEKNRKGTLGSYYAVKDYKAVNPEFGTLEDFKELVKKVHNLDMHIILDWVANHSAWDHPWIESNPEWYLKDSIGNIISPVADWSDVAGFTYENQELRKAMIDALEFWVVETNIDGYRCDVAGMVPTEFWENATSALMKHKHVFMLAEANVPEHHNYAFDMSYAWNMHFVLNEVFEGKKTLADIDSQLLKDLEEYPSDAYRMNFTSNHDENSWKGNAVKRLGPAKEVMAVFTLTASGMPLIYSGQEACLDKDLEFFEKDLIDWKECDITELYTKLLHLKKENKALWNGDFGGQMEKIATSNDASIYAFSRLKDGQQVISILNMSDKEVEFELNEFETANTLYEVFNGDQFEQKDKFTLDPWGFFVYATR